MNSRKIKILIKYFSAVLATLLCYSLVMAANDEARELEEAVKKLSRSKQSQTYVFTSPPRGKKDLELDTYKPIAEYLSKATGVNWVYKMPSGWYAYQKDILSDSSDLFFDGAHFSSWRINNTGHTAIAKLPKPMIFRLVVKTNSDLKLLKNNSQMIKALQGKRVCLNNPPNFLTLTLLSHFKNPLRQPILVSTKGPKNLFKGLMEDKCIATMLPAAIHNKFDTGKNKTRIIHTHRAYPNQSFTISPKVPAKIKQKVQSALLSSASKKALTKLYKTYSKGATLVRPEKDEYKYVSRVLGNSYGFGFNFNKPVMESYSH